MQALNIEWRHYDVGGETCERCYDTGENLTNEVKRLKRVLESKGYEITLTETLLDEGQISQSNAILFNGVSIEDLLDIEVAENYCASCSSLTGKETFCRTVLFEGNEYEDIPAKAIRQAAYKALGLEPLSPKTPEKRGCCCGGSGCC